MLTDFAAFSDDRLAEALEAAQVAIVDAIRDKDADRVGYYDDSITAIVAEQDRRTDRRPLAGAAKTEVDSFLATITGFASFPAYVNIGPDGTAVYWGSVFIARLPVAGTSQQGRGRSGGQVATFGDLRAEVEAYIANGLRFTDHPHGGTGR